MAQHHFFVAVPVNDNVRTALDQWANKYKSEVAFKNWVHPEDYHITLAFLGSSTQESIERLNEQLMRAVASFSPFELELTEMNIFGPKDRPRILWCGVSHSEELHLLQQNVYRICQETGYKLDKKPFKPHITLARKWMGDGDLQRGLLGNEVNFEENWQIGNISLFQSHLERTPKYVEIASFPFQSM